MEKFIVVGLLLQSVLVRGISYGGESWIYNYPNSDPKDTTECGGPSLIEDTPCSQNYWGRLYPLCGPKLVDGVSVAGGAYQSPIDIDTSKLITGQSGYGDLTLTYAVCQGGLELVNNNHTLEIDYTNCLSSYQIYWQGLNYQLNQFHLHSPSEHTINGLYYNAEIHLVHKTATNPKQILVVAVLLNVASGDSFFPKLYGQYYQNGEGPAVSKPLVNPYLSLLHNQPDRAYMTYNGSLTTPPCTQGVTWVVMQNPQPIDKTFLAWFNSTLVGSAGSQTKPSGANNRLTQSLNSRKVFLHTPTVSTPGSGSSRPMICHCVGMLAMILSVYFASL